MDDNIELIRKEIAALREYERKYHAGEPAFVATVGRLTRIAELLADELKRQRDDGGIASGGIEVFSRDDFPGA